jgi:hypothetical protein
MDISCKYPLDKKTHIGQLRDESLKEQHKSFILKIRYTEYSAKILELSKLQKMSKSNSHTQYLNLIRLTYNSPSLFRRHPFPHIH